jgi:hypothetical protein
MNCKLSKRHLTHRPIDQARVRRILAAFLVGLTLMKMPTIVASEELTIRPQAAPGPLDNPLKGWCPYTDAGEITQPYSMVFQYVSWKHLEPHEGEYRFEEWEAEAWSVARAKGKHIIFRVYVDYPNLETGMPEWLVQQGVRMRPYKDHGGGLAPDYDDARMILAMENFIAALGRRYNQHPRVAFVQLGMLGFWGEWHTWPKEMLYASLKTEQRIIDAYRKAMPEKSLMVRYGRDYAGKQSWIGFHDDMFPQDTDNGTDWSFLAGLRASNRTENWKTAVVGGEMVPNQAGKWLGKNFVQTKKMVTATHFSWIGPYCPALERKTNREFQRHSDELVRLLGYEFRLTEIRTQSSINSGGQLSLRLRGENQGVAPFYYMWPMAVGLLDMNGRLVKTFATTIDIRKWQPGDFDEVVLLSVDVPPGEYDLAVGIIDPWTSKPSIQFANHLSIVDGWSVLSKVNVTPKKQ